MPYRVPHLVRAAAVASLLGLGSLVHAQTCRIEIEPNETPGTATDLAGARCLEGAMPSGDQDAYALTIGEDETFVRYEMVVEGPAGVLTQADVLRVEFAPNGMDVLSADRLLTFGTSDGRSNRSEPFLLAPGPYTIGMSTSGGGAGYRMALEAADDAPATQPGPSGAWVDAFRSHVAPAAQAGELAWSVTRDDTLWRIDVHAALGDAVDVALVGGDGSTIADGSARGDRSVVWTDLRLEPGGYTLEVAGPRTGGLILVATAEGNPGAAGESEPNDEPDQADPLATGEALPGSLRDGDVDRFTFDVDASLAEQVFDLVIDTAVDVGVTLSDDAGTVLQERRGSGGALRSLRLPEGRYRLALVGHADGPYALSFSLVGSPQSGVEEEPNDTVGAAYPLDDTLSVRAALGPQDTDVFRFRIGDDGAAAGRYRVQVLARDEGVARVQVRSIDGTTLAETSVGAGEQRIRLDDVDLPPGEYAVVVEGANAEYAVRMLNLGELAERPPDLAADQEGSDETLEVETVDDDPTAEGAAVESPPEEAPDDSEAQRPSEPTDRPCIGGLVDGELVTGRPATFRLADEEAFSCGDLVSTVASDGGVELDAEPAAFRFIWVAASQRGTVIKIDTDTGEILGEYWSAPVFDPLAPSMNPSRSVVDGNGNAWIGNRNDGFENRGSVVKIGLLENGQCVDRNGDGEIQTSQGLGDVLPWTNENDADLAGGVSTAQDECILAYVPTTSSGIRHLSVNGDNDVWVSGTGGRDYDLIDGETFEIVRTEDRYGCGGYGGLIDREGVLWSARSLLRWDPSEPLTRENVLCDHNWTYGLGLGPDDLVWASNYDTSVCRLTREGEIDVCHDAEDTPLGADAGLGAARGVAVTDDGDVWVAFTGGDRVGRFDPEDGLVALVPVGGSPTGISIDARGKVWVTNRTSSNAMRIDPATDEVDLTVGLGGRGDPEETPFYDNARPYTYSDMTGQLVFEPPELGTWTVTLRGPTFRTEWQTITYDADVPAGGDVVVRVSASDAGPTSGATVVSSGDVLDALSSALVVSVTLRRAPDGSTPVLRNLAVEAVPQPLAPGTVEVLARPDLVAQSNAIGVILDASGSMGQLLPEGVSRMDAAQQVLVDLANSAFPIGVPLSMRVFGHLEPATCHMALELPLAPFEPEAFIASVRGYVPKLLSGTPLAEALEAAGEDLAEAEGRKMVVLVTDGEESCGGDPEAAIANLAQQGIETVNIVGFALEDDAVKDRMRGWAELGGGRYADAGTGEELARALNEILQPEFVLTDPFGEEVARGRVNLGPVEVPSGLYDLEVLSTPRKRIDGIRVVESDVSLTVRLQEPDEEP